MQETVKIIGNWIVWIASVGGAVAAIWKWVAKPLNKIPGRFDTLQASVNVLTDDVGDILCDRLNQAHDHWVGKGYCPKADKTRLLDMHARYTKLGRNHLAASYEKDLLRLPERPPDRLG